MASLKYRRREPEKSPFYDFVLNHWLEFLQTADTRSGNARRLPKYIRNTVESFLKCGIPACAMNQSAGTPSAFPRTVHGSPVP